MSAGLAVLAAGVVAVPLTAAGYATLAAVLWVSDRVVARVELARTRRKWDRQSKAVR